MVSLVWKRLSQPPVCTEYVECTDCTADNGRKMFNILFTVVHHGQLLCSSSVFSPLTRRGVDDLMLACQLRGEGMVAPPFYFCMKKMLNEGNQIHNFILYLWEPLWFYCITVLVTLLNYDYGVPHQLVGSFLSDGFIRGMTSTSMEFDVALSFLFVNSFKLSHKRGSSIVNVFFLV